MPITFGIKRVYDPFPTHRRAVAYVSGSARSGTTWLADMIANAAGARVVFEPLHHRGPVARPPHFIAAGDPPRELANGIDNALRGRFRRGTVNAFQPGGIYFYRVVKDIRPGLIPAVRAVAPTLPLLHIIRHPIEVAVSRAQLDTRDNWWDTDQAIAELRAFARQPGPLAELAATAVAAIDEDLTELTRHVAIWCVENAIARAAAIGPNCLMLRYEDLLVEPEKHLKSIEGFLGLSIDRAKLTQPTATSFRDKTAVRQLGKWRQHVDSTTATRLLRLAAPFALDGLYGTNPDDDLPPQ